MALTAQEAAELSKIVSGVRSIAAALSSISGVIGSDTVGFDDTKRTNLAFAIDNLMGASLDYELAMSYILNVYIINDASRAANPYPQNILNAKTEFATATNLLSQAIPRLGASPDLSDALSKATAAQTVLSTVDLTLAYQSPFPGDYPDVIGPHGDYDTTQSAIIEVRKYLGESSILGIYFPSSFKTWSAAWNGNFAGMVSTSAGIIDKQIRILGLNAGIETPDDSARLDVDFAAGTGLRPRAFFRVLLGVELALNTGRFPVGSFSGRPQVIGISADLHGQLTFTSFFIGQLDKTDPNMVNWVWQQGVPGGFFSDFAICWRALDTWGAQDLLFVHEIPKPPVPLTDGGVIPAPGGTTPPPAAVYPVGYADTQIAELNTVITQLKAKEGQPLN